MKSTFDTTTTAVETASSGIVNASGALDYPAWTVPCYLINRWGPSGFSSMFFEFDLRPGGKWSFIMHGPDKGNYRNECEFIEVIKPSLISWKRFSHPLFQVVVTFEEYSIGRTKINYRQVFYSAVVCNKI